MRQAREEEEGKQGQDMKEIKEDKEGGFERHTIASSSDSGSGSIGSGSSGSGSSGSGLSSLFPLRRALRVLETTGGVDPVDSCVRQATALLDHHSQVSGIPCSNYAVCLCCLLMLCTNAIIHLLMACVIGVIYPVTHPAGSTDLLAHPFSTPYPHNLIMHPLNTPSQHTLSTLLINPPLSTPPSHLYLSPPLINPSPHTPLSSPPSHLYLPPPLINPSPHTPLSSPLLTSTYHHPHQLRADARLDRALARVRYASVYGPSPTMVAGTGDMGGDDSGGGSDGDGGGSGGCGNEDGDDHDGNIIAALQAAITQALHEKASTAAIAQARAFLHKLRSTRDKRRQARSLLRSAIAMREVGLIQGALLLHSELGLGATSDEMERAQEVVE